METAHIELNFRPNVQLVTVVRRFVSQLYQGVLSDDATSRIALVTHELLENVVKYSRDGETTIRIEVVLGPPRRVVIQIRNRAQAHHIQTIREIVDGVNRAPDTMAFYQDLIVRKSKDQDGSGLGLARICAEGGMRVTYDVQGDVVLIEATSLVGGVGEAA